MPNSNTSRFWNQSFCIPKPTLTEQNLPDQSGRVVIVTGGYTGIGYELSKILYQRNASIYLAGRSPDKAQKAVERLREEFPYSGGSLEVLKLDLSDLSTIKASAKEFLLREQRLDVLVNNGDCTLHSISEPVLTSIFTAGVMHTPVGAKAAQGHELQMGTNCLGPYLFTKLLTPLLQSTAASSPAGSVRVLWAGSLGIDVQSPPDGGLDMDPTTSAHIPDSKNTMSNYGMSKVGNLFLSSQFTVHYPLQSDGKGVFSLCFNPGNLKTELQREVGSVVNFIISTAMLYPAVFGGYTELFAGWSNETGRKESNGRYVIPWGRLSDVREDIQAEVDKGLTSKVKSDGKAAKFWDWCEKETSSYS